MFNSSYYGGILPSTGTGLVLSVIAFIAAIVVTVLLYMKYISEGKVTTQATKHDWGPFFRFESLIIEKILKVLYLFTTCLIAFEAIASIIASFTIIVYAPGMAITGIITILIVCALLELLNRLGFEFTLMIVLIWKNTSDIRKTMKNGSANNTVSSAGASTSTASSSKPTAPAAGTTAPMPSIKEEITENELSKKPETASFTQSKSTSWICPQCGNTNKAGTFCSQCGTKKSE